MGKRIVKWWRAATAAFVALVAVLFVMQRSRHEKKQEKLGQRAQQLEHDRGATVNEAVAARRTQSAARHRAEAAREEAEARIKILEESNETLAVRVRAYNQRRSERLRNRNAP